jgi:hypothetical protein
VHKPKKKSFLLDVTFSSNSRKREKIIIIIIIIIINKSTHLIQDTSLPHLVSLFLAPPILVLLVGRGVIAQAPSSTNNNNTSSNRNPRIQSQEKFAAFNIK